MAIFLVLITLFFMLLSLAPLMVESVGWEGIGKDKEQIDE